MSYKTISLLVTITLLGSFLFTGCGPQADLSLKFQQDQTQTYQYTTNILKDYEFVQPSLGKQDKKQTGTISEAVLTQAVTEIKDNGSAMVKVTINELSFILKGKEGINYSYDSSNPDDANKPLAKAIGKSYLIEMMPDGSVKLVNAMDIIKAVSSGQDAKIAASFVSKDMVQLRHGVTALPTDGASKTQGQSWTKSQPSPKGMLTKRTYEKVYTLESITQSGDASIATISMDASPGAKTGTGDLGMFSNMFDTEETYVGQMKMDLNTGNVLDYHEKLSAVYIAAENPKDGDPDKGPDTLTMGFTQEITIKAMN